MAHLETKFRHRRALVFFPGVIFVLALGLVFGNLFGRKASVQCSRDTGLCHVETWGYLFPYPSDDLPIVSIQGLNHETVVNTQDRRMTGKNRTPSVTTRQHNLYFELDPKLSGDNGFSLRVQTYDVLSDGTAVNDAIQKLSHFLNTPEEPSVAVSFGTHRTGYAMALLFAGILIAGVLYSSDRIVRVEVRRSRGYRNQTNISVFLERVVWLGDDSFSIELDGSQDLTTDQLWADKFPAGYPSALRAQLLQVARSEQALLEKDLQQTGSA